MAFRVLPADPGSWRDKPPRLALLRSVAAVPLLASAALAWRQWRDAGNRVRAPWEERASFSAQTLAGTASTALTALLAEKGVPLPLPAGKRALALMPPATEEARSAAVEAEKILTKLRSEGTSPDTQEVQKLAREMRNAVTESGLPFPPLLWHAAAHGPPGNSPPPEFWAKELAVAVTEHPSVLSGRLLESAAGLLTNSPRSVASSQTLPLSDIGVAAAAAGSSANAAAEAALLILRDAQNRWHDMESLAGALNLPDNRPRPGSGEPFWTVDGGWLVFPPAAPEKPDEIPNLYRGLRRDGLVKAFSDSLRIPDSRLTFSLEAAGREVTGLGETGEPQNDSSTSRKSEAEAGPSAVEATAFSGPLRVQVRLKDAGALEAALSSERRTLLLWPVLAALSGLGGWLALERALRRQERLGRLKTDFVSSVSHELRAPVAGIRLLAERMAAGKADTEQTAAYSRLIEREARRVSALVENVLDFARIENGRKAYHFAECDPAQALREAAETMEPLAAARGLSLHPEFCPESPATPLRADAAALRQALVNLLDNAVKFSPPGGRVGLSLEIEKDGSAVFRIRDQGPGIPASELPLIFDRFFRGGDELRRSTPGAGIGLSLVRHIARIHGGEVSVKAPPGQGSEFTLRLPACPPLPPESETLTPPCPEC